MSEGPPWRDLLAGAGGASGASGAGENDNPVAASGASAGFPTPESDDAMDFTSIKPPDDKPKQPRGLSNDEKKLFKLKFSQLFNGNADVVRNYFELWKDFTGKKADLPTDASYDKLFRHVLTRKVAFARFIIKDFVSYADLLEKVEAKKLEKEEKERKRQQNLANKQMKLQEKAAKAVAKAEEANRKAAEAERKRQEKAAEAERKAAEAERKQQEKAAEAERKRQEKAAEAERKQQEKAAEAERKAAESERKRKEKEAEAKRKRQKKVEGAKAKAVEKAQIKESLECLRGVTFDGDVSDELKPHVGQTSKKTIDVLFGPVSMYDTDEFDGKNFFKAVCGYLNYAFLEVPDETDQSFFVPGRGEIRSHMYDLYDKFFVSTPASLTCSISELISTREDWCERRSLEVLFDRAQTNADGVSHECLCELGRYIGDLLDSLEVKWDLSPCFEFFNTLCILFYDDEQSFRCLSDASTKILPWRAENETRSLEKYLSLCLSRKFKDILFSNCWCEGKPMWSYAKTSEDEAICTVEWHQTDNDEDIYYWVINTEKEGIGSKISWKDPLEKLEEGGKKKLHEKTTPEICTDENWKSVTSTKILNEKDKDDKSGILREASFVMNTNGDVVCEKLEIEDEHLPVFMSDSIVTLTDIQFHILQNEEWFTRDLIIDTPEGVLTESVYSFSVVLWKALVSWMKKGKNTAYMRFLNLIKDDAFKAVDTIPIPQEDDESEDDEDNGIIEDKQESPVYYDFENDLLATKVDPVTVAQPISYSGSKKRIQPLLVSQQQEKSKFTQREIQEKEDELLRSVQEQIKLYTFDWLLGLWDEWMVFEQPSLLFGNLVANKFAGELWFKKKIYEDYTTISYEDKLADLERHVNNETVQKVMAKFQTALHGVLPPNPENYREILKNAKEFASFIQLNTTLSKVAEKQTNEVFHILKTRTKVLSEVSKWQNTLIRPSSLKGDLSSNNKVYIYVYNNPCFREYVLKSYPSKWHRLGGYDTNDWEIKCFKTTARGNEVDFSYESLGEIVGMDVDVDDTKIVDMTGESPSGNQRKRKATEPHDMTTEKVANSSNGQDSRSNIENIEFSPVLRAAETLPAQPQQPQQTQEKKRRINEFPSANLIEQKGQQTPELTRLLDEIDNDDMLYEMETLQSNMQDAYTNAQTYAENIAPLKEAESMFAQASDEVKGFFVDLRNELNKDPDDHPDEIFDIDMYRNKIIEDLNEKFKKVGGLHAKFIEFLEKYPTLFKNNEAIIEIHRKFYDLLSCKSDFKVMADQMARSLAALWAANASSVAEQVAPFQQEVSEAAAKLQSDVRPKVNGIPAYAETLDLVTNFVDDIQVQILSKVTDLEDEGVERILDMTDYRVQPAGDAGDMTRALKAANTLNDLKVLIATAKKHAQMAIYMAKVAREANSANKATDAAKESKRQYDLLIESDKNALELADQISDKAKVSKLFAGVPELVQSADFAYTEAKKYAEMKAPIKAVESKSELALIEFKNIATAVNELLERIKKYSNVADEDAVNKYYDSYTSTTPDDGKIFSISRAAIDKINAKRSEFDNLYNEFEDLILCTEDLETMAWSVVHSMAALRATKAANKHIDSSTKPTEIDHWIQKIEMFYKEAEKAVNELHSGISHKAQGTHIDAYVATLERVTEFVETARNDTLRDLETAKEAQQSIKNKLQLEAARTIAPTASENTSNAQISGGVDWDSESSSDDGTQPMDIEGESARNPIIISSDNEMSGMNEDSLSTLTDFAMQPL